MALIASSTKGASITPIEEGTYTGTCYAIIDNGDQYSETFKKYSHKVTLMWELLDTFIEVDGEQQPRSISKTYTLSLNEKSDLRKDLRSWRGREFTDEELEGFELKNVLGVPCLLNIIHKTGTERTYAVIAGIMKMPKGATAPKLISDEIYFDLEESPLDMIDTLPEFLQKRIKDSPTYKERVKSGGFTDSDYEAAQVPEGEEDLPF